MSTEELAPSRSRGGFRWLAVVAVVSSLAVLGVVGVVWWQQEHGRLPALAGERYRSFPTVDRTGLDDTQNRIVDVLRTEFDQQNDGLKYAEGIDEPWCADFVSWVMREAGRPLANPNSGTWRIPGVYTLTEYYQGQNRFEAPGYRAKTGDVVLYSDSSVFNQHTNIVVAADADTITTVGGNEFGRITIHRFRPTDVNGLVGFGRL